MNWQVAAAIGIWVVAIAGAVNLWWLRGFLTTAREQARAAFRQAEGLLKPVVVVASTTTVPVDASAPATGEIPAEIYGDHVRFINIGNGPALDLAWTYERVHGKAHGKCAYLAPACEFAIKIPVEVGAGEKSIHVEYVSFDNVRYVSDTVLRDRVIERSTVREA